MATKHSKFKIDQEILKFAYLETVYWWVDCEKDYHNAFKNISQDSLPYNYFYEFTKKYSVRRTVKHKLEKDEPINLLLEHLVPIFSESALKGKDIGIIDKFKEFEGNSIISLLSKFATLINPTSYTMYDGNSKASLKKLKKRKGEYTTYTSFWNDFVTYKSDFIGQLKPKDTEFWLNVICGRFDNGKNICTREVFENRLADKYLWVLKNEE